MYVCVCVCESLSRVKLFVTPWTIAPRLTIHGIFQVRILEWVAISFSRLFSKTRGRTQVSCITGRLSTSWATREALWWVIIHLEPDILECEVKWALGSITTNKASGGDGNPVELFQILKDDAVKVLHSICQQIWKTQQWPQDWKRSVFIPSPKKGNAKECSNYCTIALISHASKVMLKILQAKLQQYVNHELPVVQAGFRKGRGTRDQIANIRWIIEKAREFQKNIYLCFIGCAKAFDCVDHHKLWKILKQMEIPDLLTCLLRNLYAGQEATVRTRHVTTDWFQIGKGVCQGCILSSCLFNLYVESTYIM